MKNQCLQSSKYFSLKWKSICLNEVKCFQMESKSNPEKLKQENVSTRYYKCLQGKQIYESKHEKLSCSKGNN